MCLTDDSDIRLVPPTQQVAPQPDEYGRPEWPLDEQPCIRDSGQRAECPTGAVRDKRIGKGCPSLLLWSAIEEDAKVLEAGAAKYSRHNYERGMPLSWFADSALRHILKYLAGHRDEPHLGMARFNLAGLIDTEQRIRAGLLPRSLDDLRPALSAEESAALFDVADSLNLMQQETPL